MRSHQVWGKSKISDMVKASREDNKERELAARIAQAMSMAGLFGRPYHTGWPVAWVSSDGEAHCCLYGPPADGLIDDYFVGDRPFVHSSDLFVERGQVSRDVGLQLLA